MQITEVYPVLCSYILLCMSMIQSHVLEQLCVHVSKINRIKIKAIHRLRDRDLNPIGKVRPCTRERQGAYVVAT